ncbi:MAG: ATP-binding cassette domain-containing protein [Silvanigrellaceae bacterium]|nr:ATP-binding cassette domain-containing protein [Silvanigrellaceae bacterium]
MIKIIFLLTLICMSSCYSCESIAFLLEEEYPDQSAYYKASKNNSSFRVSLNDPIHTPYICRRNYFFLLFLLFSDYIQHAFSFCNPKGCYFEKKTFLKIASSRDSLYSNLQQFISHRSGKLPPSWINVEKLDLSFGDKTLFDNLDFSIKNGEVATIVGENGCGKSTFLKILAGHPLPCSGKITICGKIAYLPQSFEELDDDIPALLHMLYLENDNERFQNALNDNLLFSPEWVQSVKQEGVHKLLRELSKIGIDYETLKKPFQYLSGGQKTKAVLSALLKTNPDILLLDEPTNHLDLVGLKWLERTLQSFSGSVVMVTHDRSLISDVSHKISELSPQTKKFTHFKGGYKNYLEEQNKIRIRCIQKRQQEEKELKLLNAKTQKLQTTLKASTKRKSKDSDKLGFNARGERKQKGTSGVINQYKQKTNRLLEELTEIPPERTKIDFSFLEDDDMHSLFLSANEISMKYEEFLFTHLSFHIQSGDKLIVKGPNGSGKTTLLKILMKELTPFNGTISLSSQGRIGYLDQEQDGLSLDQTPIQLLLEDPQLTLTRSDAIHSLGKFGIFTYHDLNSPLNLLSIGTRRKAQLCQIVLNKPNILLLDEPTNHIDFSSLEVIEDSLQNFTGILIVVTHDRYFSEKIGNKIINLEHYR